MYVVGEVLLLINFLMNALILCLTAKILNYPVSKSRLMIVAFVASLYFLFPFNGHIYEFIFKFIFSWVIITLVFLPKKIKESLLILFVFYAVSSLLGGGVFGLIFLTKPFERLAFGEVSWGYLFFAVAISGSIIWGLKMVEDKIKCKNHEVIMEVYFKNNVCTFKALVDSGNLLKTTFGTPCTVVEKEAVKELLPSHLYNNLYKKDNELYNLYDIYDKINLEDSRELKLQPIFFNSVGNKNDVLLAFKPDRIIIRNLDYYESKQVVSMIALSKNKLNLPEGYYGLLPPGLV